jgi:hypothetical protein
VSHEQVNKHITAITPNYLSDEKGFQTSIYKNKSSTVKNHLAGSLLIG